MLVDFAAGRMRVANSSAKSAVPAPWWTKGRERSFALAVSASELGGILKAVTSDVLCLLCAGRVFVCADFFACVAPCKLLYLLKSGVYSVYTAMQVGDCNALGRDNLGTDTASAPRLLTTRPDHNRQAPEYAPQPAREPLP